MNKDIFLPTVAEFLSMTTQGSQSIGETRQRKQNPHSIHNVAASRPSNVSRAQSWTIDLHFAPTGYFTYHQV